MKTFTVDFPERKRSCSECGRKLLNEFHVRVGISSGGGYQKYANICEGCLDLLVYELKEARRITERIANIKKAYLG